VEFIEAKDVQASVTAPNLDVAIVRSVPLIERFENVDLMLPEMKFQGHGHSAIVSMLFDMNTHFGSRVIRNDTPRRGQPGAVEQLEPIRLEHSLNLINLRGRLFSPIAIDLPQKSPEKGLSGRTDR
jgi:hypothetical protein